MAKPFNAKRILLTPKTWNVVLDVTDHHYPKAISIKGRMGESQIDVKLTANECRHLAQFFQFQANRMDQRKT